MILGQLSPPQVADNLDCAVENHKQRHVEGKEKPKLAPAQVAVGLSFNHEAFTVGLAFVFQSEDMGGH